MLESIDLVKDYCDAINITDNPRGIPSMSSLVGSHYVLRAGTEPIMQVATCDKTRNGLESDLYGAYSLGIRNILFISGDYYPYTTSSSTERRTPLDCIEALQLTSYIMTGKDLEDDEIEGIPNFFLGATFNPNADSIDTHVQRIERKIAAGASFFQTQAIYESDQLVEFMEHIKHMNLKIIVGIIPLSSPEIAEFMNDEVQDINVPSEIIERLHNAGSGYSEDERLERTQTEGLKIALENLQEIRKVPGISGVHIMSVGWPESIPYLVDASNLYPRPE